MYAVLAQATWGDPSEATASLQGDDMAAYLLLLLLAAVIVLGAVTFLLVLHFIRQRPRDHADGSHPGTGAAGPISWQNGGLLLVPARWMAVRASTVREVRNALELSNATPCTIEDGLAGNHGQALFLAPPVNGWVLITGPGVPDPAADIDEVYHLLRSLSIKLGAAQFFSFNRALGHHAWAWARGGGIVRAFAWTGQTVWIEGEPTPAEKALQLRTPGYGEAPRRFAHGVDPLLSNLDRVPILAARWSLEPVSVHQQQPHAVGVSGEFTRVRSS